MREISSVMFVRDVLCARIDSSSLLGMLAPKANPHRTRSRTLLLEKSFIDRLKVLMSLWTVLFGILTTKASFCTSGEGGHELLWEEMFSRLWPFNDVIFVVFYREIYFFLYECLFLQLSFFSSFLFKKKWMIIYWKLILRVIIWVIACWWIKK
jgi:hypothetical protein